jgi:hypothetical protein
MFLLSCHATIEEQSFFLFFSYHSSDSEKGKTAKKKRTDEKQVGKEKNLSPSFFSTKKGRRRMTGNSILEREIKFLVFMRWISKSYLLLLWSR